MKCWNFNFHQIKIRPIYSLYDQHRLDSISFSITVLIFIMVMLIHKDLIQLLLYVKSLNAKTQGLFNCHVLHRRKAAHIIFPGVACWHSRISLGCLSSSAFLSVGGGECYPVHLLILYKRLIRIFVSFVGF